MNTYDLRERAKVLHQIPGFVAYPHGSDVPLPFLKPPANVLVERDVAAFIA